MSPVTTPHRKRTAELRLAIATENGTVSAHFGHCPEFTLVDVEDGAVSSRRAVAAPPHQPGVIPMFLKDQGVDVIVAGGMGRKAADIFNDVGIEQVVGVSGSVDAAIEAWLDGSLSGDGSLCDHESHH